MIPSTLKGWEKLDGGRGYRFRAEHGDYYLSAESHKAHEWAKPEVLGYAVKFNSNEPNAKGLYWETISAGHKTANVALKSLVTK